MDNNIQNSQNDSEWKNSFSKLNDWDSLPPLDGWEKISEQLDKPSRPKLLYWFVALGFILFSGIGSGIYLNQSEKNNKSSEFVSVNTPQIVKEEKNQVLEIEKLDNSSAKENSVIKSNSEKSISDKFFSSKAIKSSKHSDKIAITQEKKSNIVLSNDLNNNKGEKRVVNKNQKNLPQKDAEMATNTDEDKKIRFVLEEIPLGKIKLNADPFFEMQIDSIKLVSNNDKIDSLSKVNSSLPKKSDAISTWKIASYTGVGLTYKHFTANPNDNHYVKMLNEKQTINERQNLTFGFTVEKELSKKWNLHADIGILKWKNTIEYKFVGNYYSAPTKYTATKISTNHVSIQPIYEDRESIQIQTLNYETTYFKTDLGISYSLFQSKKWKHQMGLKTGLLLLTNETTNYTAYQSTTQFPSAKKAIPFLAGFHQTHYQLNNHWGIFGESSLKYLPNSVGDKNTIWQIRFYQINLHVGISYKF
ncbi:hypothetical protein ACE193_18890 [Bernardetia sp. OM2101]|uniref:hypothetical protein n=1 Tax=Bernardetia sp. OM2101 TaxID=3344876 RepID=UPI0035D0F5B0